MMVKIFNFGFLIPQDVRSHDIGTSSRGQHISGIDSGPARTHNRPKDGEDEEERFPGGMTASAAEHSGIPSNLTSTLENIVQQLDILTQVNCF